MGQQFFGSVETAFGAAHAMLCIDEDRPDEFMLHIWGEAVKPTAVLLTAEWIGPAAKLTPKTIFRVSEIGNVFVPSETDLTPEERQFRSKTTATLQLKTEGGYAGTWTDHAGVTREVDLGLTSTFKPTAPVHTCDSWWDFKKWADNARSAHHCTAFRGHGNNEFRLQTTLARVGRTRIDRYCASELVAFNSLLEASLEMRFDLMNKDDYATVLGLAQHHGLPTPLLDWTSSPYVAAFFAFSDAIDMAQSRKDATHVRIFALTDDFTTITSPPVVTVSALVPYVCSLTISARHNPRLLAQQGRFLVTNMSNVEAFIYYKESEDKSTYLYAADVPISAAPDALEDLAFMGLTAATMFPGLDGVGRMIRHQMLFKTAKGNQGRKRVEHPSKPTDSGPLG